ncbi:MAG: efflux RND transporter permease subunit [Alphaproteobacteria bacterium]|nr:efflux RND transporter permease subunit [Alphaproteobacteria bacterium]
MKLPELSIRRPVLATVMSLLLTLVGIIALQRLTVREYPNIDEPVVTVTTTYKGASSEVVESQVTKVMEDSLAGIEGVDVLSSISRAERSQITVRFRSNRDPESAASDVRDRVGRVRGRLPEDVDEPVVAKVEADAQPIIYLAFSSDRHDTLFITDYAERYVKDRIQNINGVADVAIYGARRFAMRIWLDSARLAAYRLTPLDVENALKRQNVEIPAGRIESMTREFTVLSETDLQTPEQFGEVIIGDSGGGYMVRIRDVARVELGPEDERRIARYKGKTAITLGIIKQSTANPLDVAKGLRVLLPTLTDSLPEGLNAEVGYDTTLFISESIDSVFKTIFEATLLVVLVIFFFLRTVRATLIPIVTIPVSLIGAAAIMYAFNFSINTLTLLSMVLAIGLVVDDAIVMLENIYRHIEDGMPPMKAALNGSREIGFAVLAMTITLAAVYVPIGFMTGRTGRLFTEFALTLAGAVIVSGFVALTLSPMMCSRMLKHEKKHSRFYNVIETFLNDLTQGYQRLLVASLGKRMIVVIVGLAVALSSGGLIMALKSELAPIEDRGTIMATAIAPEGSTIAYTDRYLREVEEIIKTIPEVDRFMAVAGVPVVSQAISFSRLKEWGDRSRSQMDIVKSMTPRLMAIPGVLAFAVNPASLGQRPTEKPVQFVVQTQLSYPELQTMVQALIQEASKYPGLMALDTDLRLNKPQLRVTVNREKVADVGASVDQVGRALETMLGGRQVTRFKREGYQYDVIVQVADIDRQNPDDLSAIYVRARDGRMVQLSNLLNVEETVAPRELNHFNQMRAATITANIAPGYALGEAIAFLEETAARVLPSVAQYDFNGQSREFKTSRADMILTFVLALFFIYLVLAAQFESFVDPFVIMLTVPLSMTGALLALKLSGGTLNVYSQIGLVTLVGLITKHGILIVEFANQLQDVGKSKIDAVVDAATLRLRPILMTTGAMVLGALPLALGSGAGAESRSQIGWVIVGGLLLGTCLTLFVVPTAYSFLARTRQPLSGKTPSEPLAASG